MTPTLAEIMQEHETFELESIDRLYLNGYVPGTSVKVHPDGT